MAHDRFPISTDFSGRFLSWLTAVMSFLGTIALAGALSLNNAVESWHADMSGILTVQVPTASYDGSSQENAHSADQQMDKVTRLLQSSPGIVSATVIPNDRVAALLEPWLGSRDLIAALPVPRLVDVRVADDHSLNVTTLRSHLADAVPGTQVDDHRTWLSRLIKLVANIQLMTWAALSIIFLTMIATTAYATRSALALHRPHIEVMHLVGAADAYIARQFARRALVYGCVGGLVGLAAAGPMLWLTGRALSELQLDTGVGIFSTLTPLQMTIIAAIPVIAGSLSMTVAHVTVRHLLGRML